MKLISIVGLTASGKSGIGIKLAQKYNGEIISCDSRQVYTGLDIGSAKVTAEEQAMAPHHLLDIVEPGGKMDVAAFQKIAWEKIHDIWSRGKLPILVGGTGLYTRAIIQHEQYNFSELGWVMSGDNESAVQVLQIALLPAKEWLGPIVEQRNQQRYEMGMIDETKNLLANGVNPAWLKSLGLDYKLTTEFVEGKWTWEEFKYWHLIRTMQYAKRQRTWFKREKDTIFLTNPETFLNDCIKMVEKFVQD